MEEKTMYQRLYEDTRLENNKEYLNLERRIKEKSVSELERMFPKLESEVNKRMIKQAIVYWSAAVTLAISYIFKEYGMNYYALGSVLLALAHLPVMSSYENWGEQNGNRMEKLIAIDKILRERKN